MRLLAGIEPLFDTVIKELQGGDALTQISRFFNGESHQFKCEHTDGRMQEYAYQSWIIIIFTGAERTFFLRRKYDVESELPENVSEWFESELLPYFQGNLWFRNGMFLFNSVDFSLKGDELLANIKDNISELTQIKSEITKNWLQISESLRQQLSIDSKPEPLYSQEDISIAGELLRKMKAKTHREIDMITALRFLAGGDGYEFSQGSAITYIIERAILEKTINATTSPSQGSKTALQLAVENKNFRLAMMICLVAIQMDIENKMDPAVRDAFLKDQDKIKNLFGTESLQQYLTSEGRFQQQEQEAVRHFLITGDDSPLKGRGPQRQTMS